MNSAYRRLRPNEWPDRAEGDQFQDTGNGYWILAIERHGDRPAHPEERWRRPRRLRPEHLHEHTAKFT